MYDPQTMQMIAILVSVAFVVVLIVCLFYGLYLLGRIRKQAVGINQRLDELLARMSPGRGGAGSAGGAGSTGMSL
ncbi:MAG: hypothetical protein EPN47_14345 [Acidobacteria bacterium]|nr:MAG: hypothetical protein EPN47_14345 [Acidobacteriota bacterium]